MNIPVSDLTLLSDQDVLRGREDLYVDMFHASAVSAWHIDTKKTLALYQRVRATGIKDIYAYAQQNPDFVQEALESLIVIDVNEETMCLFAVPHRSDVIGKSVARFWIPGLYETFLRNVEATYNGKFDYRGESPLQTFDGRRIDVLFTKSASVRLQAAGESLLSFIDLTDRVKTQNALDEAQANLVHATRISILGELTASIAHEVNQPMSAIATYGEAGLRWLNHPDPNIAEVRNVMTHMIEAARRASTVIDKIRSMVAPSAIVQQRLSLNALIREAMLFVAPILGKFAVEQTLQLSGDFSFVDGDAIQLQQVVMNLALNAAQAMDCLMIRKLYVRTSMSDTGNAQIEMDDTGPGIDVSHLEHLFDSFFTTKPDGMGIGLGICRSIVEAHGGTISLTNRAEGGVRATVRLPASLSGESIRMTGIIPGSLELTMPNDAHEISSDEPNAGRSLASTT